MKPNGCLGLGSFTVKIAKLELVSRDDTTTHNMKSGVSETYSNMQSHNLRVASAEPSQVLIDKRNKTTLPPCML